MLPLRAAPVFAATATSTFPLDCPVVRDGVSHDAAEAAFQLQPVSVTSSTANVPPAAPIESLVRFKLYVHEAAACVTPRRMSSTNTSAERAVGTGLLATVKGSVALPLPARSPVTASHGAAELTDQLQSRAAVMVSCPEPPPAVNCSGAAVAVTSHLLLDGAVDEVEAEVQAPSRHAATAAKSAEATRGC